MTRMNFSNNGIAISLILISSIFTLSVIPELYAQESTVTAKSIGFEGTTIIEFQNNDKTASIETFRIWLGADINFKSFKTERGWTGEKNEQGLIVFTTSTPLQPGEIVKFGVKTDKPKPGINWKAMAINDKQVAIGKTLVSDSSSIEPVKSSDGNGVFESSTFRLIPEKPSIGASIRVTGDNFGANQKLDFYINTKKIQSFDTDGNGHFVFTSKIPDNQDAERVDFKIKDSKGNEKSISLRIGEDGGRMPSTENIPLKINQTPPVVYRGDSITVTGTGTPGSTITGSTKNESGQTTTTIAIDVGTDGKWSYDALIPKDATLGKYTAEITDGTQVVKRTWEVASSKVIEITPSQVKFEPGETIIFNGTAKPNEELEILLEDPQGTEFYTQIMKVGTSGEVNISIKTLPSNPEGTYVLFASQGEDIEIVLVGIGELPQEKLVVKSDKLNYSPSETLFLEVQGPASSTISLLIVDPSDKNKFTDTIVLGPSGQETYELKLAGYSSGVYTAVITRGNSQATDVFSVGLLTGSGEIHARTTKTAYFPGESILVLGEASKNILLTLELKDPDGKVVKNKETFTNKDGVFSEDSFRIPLDAKTGTWIVHAQSGPNFDDVKITVQAGIEEGLVIFVDSVMPSPSGDIITLKGYGAAVSQQVIITIFSEDEEEITELSIFSTGEGDFSTIWLADNTIVPGTYTIKAKDSIDEAETTVIIK